MRLFVYNTRKIWNVFNISPLNGVLMGSLFFFYFVPCELCNLTYSRPLSIDIMRRVTRGVLHLGCKEINIGGECCLWLFIEYLNSTSPPELK